LNSNVIFVSLILTVIEWYFSSVCERTLRFFNSMPSFSAIYISIKSMNLNFIQSTRIY
jgi:hypothetical protein